jgi:hypothetical protein
VGPHRNAVLIDVVLIDVVLIDAVPPLVRPALASCVTRSQGLVSMWRCAIRWIGWP